MSKDVTFDKLIPVSYHIPGTDVNIRQYGSPETNDEYWQVEMRNFTLCVYLLTKKGHLRSKYGEDDTRFASAEQALIHYNRWNAAYGGKDIYELKSELPLAGNGLSMTLKEWKRIYGYIPGILTGGTLTRINKVPAASK